MESFLNAVQKTPLPTILILAGLLFILLGFVTKIGGFMDVSPEQRRLAIPIGLFVLFIGLVLNFAVSNTNPTSEPKIPPTTETTPAPNANAAPRTRDCIVDDKGGYFRVLIDEAKTKSNGEICYPDINQSACIPKRNCISWK